jgi:hypothetical protein
MATDPLDDARPVHFAYATVEMVEATILLSDEFLIKSHTTSLTVEVRQLQR